MVEVFKTDVNEHRSEELLQKLGIVFPGYRISFDLEDCDRVLRIEGGQVTAQQVIDLLREHNCTCEMLD